ncbi:hypothetical protein SAMN05421642_12743 [Rhodococcoides kyotonense]|uniref:Uncharacterized protein n=1 Tax=Rhodococcoides kyotonense TaxID=398843 RepID=A0A239N3U2_9NOCA|nr:hypothetical protein SAMN05421642_12743 [Rhodococcus kyotonensis]
MVFITGGVIGEVVVAEVRPNCACGDDEAVVGGFSDAFTKWLVTVLFGRLMLPTVPKMTEALAQSRRIIRVEGAISPSERMPAATW